MEKVQYEELKAQQNIHWWFRGKREIVIDYAFDKGMSQGGRILDVGCGMGLMIKALSKFGEVYGIDVEEHAVKYCEQEYFKSKDSDRVKLGSLPDDIDFDDDFFDNIFALDVIEHVDNDILALKTLYRKAKLGGWLCLTVPAHMSMWSYNDVLNHHFRRYEKNELIKKLKEAGFEVKKCSYYNFYLYPLAYVIRKVKNILGIHSSDVGEDYHDSIVNRVLFLIFSSEKYWLRKHRFPTGVSLIALARKEW